MTIDARKKKKTNVQITMACIMMGKYYIKTGVNFKN